ncbi:MAG: beta-lactamase family protein [Alphaproteobacteria bacterium]|nr:beta-lactamase family protein [Alphaproteobacteria bacterium]
MIDRRRFLAASAALGTSLPVAAAFARGAHADTVGGTARGAMADAATEFMARYDIPGLSVAIARRGQLIYEEAFGLADREAQTPLTTRHRFRVASISKPITSAAIFSLIEDGKLTLGQFVFGPVGILGESYGRFPEDAPQRAITIEHLLTHAAGGWPNDKTDPMFKYPGLDHARLIAATLRDRPLERPPGTAFSYSNFGYCLLGRVIEKVAAQPYARFVVEQVLLPADATDVSIAGNTRAERQQDEVVYYKGAKDDPYALDVRRMDSHGGWIARPSAIAKFASAAHGLSKMSLLRPDTITAMTAPSSVSASYAKGWRISRGGNLWHSGHLPGTTGLMVRTSGDVCWVGLMNTRFRNRELDRDLDRLMATMVWHAQARRT